LADAKFFFDQDQKKTLESRVEGLSKVVYHNKLGTQGERMARVCAIAKAIGQQMGGAELAAQAELAARLAKTEIRAPFEGVVGLRQVSVGEYVNAGQALVELVRLDPLEVEFQIPETQAARLNTGQSVSVQTDAFLGESFTGSISAVAPSVQVSGRSVAVRARLANAEKKLKPGQFAQVQVALAAAAPVLMVPEQAIWPSGDQKMVYRIKAGKAELVPVTLGLREPGWVAVTAGLSVGDEVIIAGQQKLFPGAPVMIGKPAAVK
jgi:membrane fusion protein (multidrug efflux system)